MSALLKFFIILVIVGLLALLMMIRHRRNAAATGGDSNQGEGEFEIVPESVSKARAARALPTKGSENATHRLAPPVVRKASRAEATDDYPPHKDLDWTILIELPKSVVLDRKQTLAILDPPWLKSNRGAIIHGLCLATGKWTYVSASDATEPYSKLALAKSLVQGPLDTPSLEAMLSSTGKKFRQFPGTVVSSSVPPAEAVAKSERLLRLKSTCDLQMMVQLLPPSGKSFDGREIWDVMYSLGLEWGDMDLFHWTNTTDCGDDSFFSVWTSTAPGYFLPESIAAGDIRVEDLVFGYSVPRSAAPAAILDRMVTAAEYSRKRLGGELRDPTGAPFDRIKSQAEVWRVCRTLEAAGFPPGSESALRLF